MSSLSISWHIFLYLLLSLFFYFFFCFNFAAKIIMLVKCLLFYCTFKFHSPFLSCRKWNNKKMSRLVTKPTKWLCAQRRLRSTWASVQSDQSSLCAQWVAKDPCFFHANSEDSDQTGRMPRLICVFAGRTLTLLVLSRGGSSYIIIWR